MLYTFRGTRTLSTCVLYKRKNLQVWSVAGLHEFAAQWTQIFRHRRQKSVWSELVYIICNFLMRKKINDKNKKINTKNTFLKAFDLLPLLALKESSRGFMRPIEQPVPRPNITGFKTSHQLYLYTVGLHGNLKGL